MPDEEDENRFISFSVFQFIFDLIRGDEGGDTYLMFQFCLPNPCKDFLSSRAN